MNEQKRKETFGDLEVEFVRSYGGYQRGEMFGLTRVVETNEFRTNGDFKYIGLVDKRTNKGFPICSVKVRGTSRTDDDNEHDYTRVISLQEKDGQVSLTLSSGYLEDTYCLNLATGETRLAGSLNLYELEQRKKANEIRQKFRGKPLDNVVLENLGKSFVEELKKVDTCEPHIVRTLTGENLGLVLIGTYTKGYDASMNRLRLYQVENSESFQEVMNQELPINHNRPKGAYSTFLVDDLKLEGRRARIVGKVMQYREDTSMAARLGYSTTIKHQIGRLDQEVELKSNPQ
ncbi:MAG: hypothetical protein NTX24_02125 [Candidatus Pacearchaeota archaeon]|nr:hypothetical protein [Candidatus Pacearchaeota archaeon]